MAPQNRVLLLGCVKLKHDRPMPARDLYRSALWMRRRAYAEASEAPWRILSAKHGLVTPDQRLAPYDLALSTLSRDERLRWGGRVVRALTRQLGPLDGLRFELHAGALYRQAIEPAINAAGGQVLSPLARLGLGQQLAWYATKTQPLSSPSGPGERRRRCTPAEVGQALAALDGASTRIAASAWPADLTGLKQPGLYSWWVDRIGAANLSAGLGHHVAPGRIYASQTGATKWPSGKAGQATLQSRIGSNHLRGRISGSTFRLTLAACLTPSLRLTHMGPRHLDPISEDRLSAWMREHLEVAVMPFAERDPLADLEDHVLDKLNPPLNLEGWPLTHLRETLSRLRAGRK